MTICFGALRGRTKEYASFLMMSRALQLAISEQPIKKLDISQVGLL